VIGALVCGSLPVAVMKVNGTFSEGQAWAMGISMFVLSSYLIHAMLIPLSAGATALYLCLVCDPKYLRENHPEEKEKLWKPWEEVHGGVLDDAFQEDEDGRLKKRIPCADEATV